MVRFSLGLRSAMKNFRPILERLIEDCSAVVPAENKVEMANSECGSGTGTGTGIMVVAPEKTQRTTLERHIYRFDVGPAGDQNEEAKAPTKYCQQLHRQFRSQYLHRMNENVKMEIRRKIFSHILEQRLDLCIECATAYFERNLDSHFSFDNELFLVVLKFAREHLNLLSSSFAPPNSHFSASAANKDELILLLRRLFEFMELLPLEKRKRGKTGRMFTDLLQLSDRLVERMADPDVLLQFTNLRSGI